MFGAWGLVGLLNRILTLSWGLRNSGSLFRYCEERTWLGKAVVLELQGLGSELL